MSAAAKLVILILVAIGGFAGGAKYHAGLIAQRDLKEAQARIEAAREQIRTDDRLAVARAKNATIRRDTLAPVVERLRHEEALDRPGCRVSGVGMRDIAALVDAANAAGGSAAALPETAPAGQ